MKLPDMIPPAGVDAAIHQLALYGGQMRQVYTIDEEKAFPEGRLITSCTDTNGVITHANEAFVLMSGWTREELIGMPHSILRHPDMPKAAFADLWDTVAAGDKWHGYVKNLRKNGGFYWVYATVIPNIRQGVIRGYTSVRRKPSRAKIAECEALYRQMRLNERETA